MIDCQARIRGSVFLSSGANDNNGVVRVPRRGTCISLRFTSMRTVRYHTVFQFVRLQLSLSSYKYSCESIIAEASPTWIIAQSRLLGNVEDCESNGTPFITVPVHTTFSKDFFGSLGNIGFQLAILVAHGAVAFVFLSGS